MYELASLNQFSVARGIVFVVPNPETSKDGDFSYILNSTVKVDGRLYIVKSIDSFKSRVVSIGSPICILCDPVEATSP